MSHDPRTGYRGFVFGDLTNPRGGDNVKDTHFMCEDYNPHWWNDQIDMPEAVKKVIYGVPVAKIPDTWEGKALMAKYFEDIFSFLNAAGVCIFVSGKSALGPTHLARLLSACTGSPCSPGDIQRFGERVFTLLKVYSLRQGLTRKDDTWPERFFTEPLAGVPRQQAVLNRDQISDLLDEYYILRGWDVTTGLPTLEKLNELGLQNIAAHLQENNHEQ
jgi:aldehyde:ferredoxin oxidoreductase